LNDELMVLWGLGVRVVIIHLTFTPIY